MFTGTGNGSWLKNKELLRMYKLLYISHMKKYLLLFFAFSFTATYSQNLVLNPSFEDTLNNCSSVNYYICENWVNANGATADYFSSYADVMDCWGWPYKTPNTAQGFQYAHNGQAFIGLDIWEPDNHVTKEYAQGFLSQPLMQGQLYYISVYINMADSSNYKSCEIDISFTDSLIYSNVLGPFNFTDTVKLNISNMDTTTWRLLTGTYTAHGGEKYIYIGSNTPNGDLIPCIDTLPTGHISNQAAYYFVDNIYVSTTPLTIDKISFPEISISPNPANAFLSINNMSNDFSYSIKNSIGQIVKCGKLSKGSTHIDISEIVPGLYWLVVENIRVQKIIIHH